MANRAPALINWVLCLLLGLIIQNAAQAQGDLPPAPRLYIHYRSADQASGAAALQKVLGSTTIAGRKLQVMVPSGEPSSKYGTATLVCERATDCAFAPELAAMLGRVLGAQVAINDVSARYEATTRSRPHHFELWFGPQSIAIADPGQAAVALARPANSESAAAAVASGGASTGAATNTDPAPSESLLATAVRWLAAILAIFAAVTGGWMLRRRPAPVRNYEAPSGTQHTASSPVNSNAGMPIAAVPAKLTPDEQDPRPVSSQYPWEPDPPRKLVEAVAKRQSVLVVGAGVSHQAGFPSLNQLIHRLLQQLGPRTSKNVTALVGDNPTEHDLAALAAELGGSKLFEAVIAGVPRDVAVAAMREALPLQPSALHEVLAEVPWRAIVDLNVDNLMSQAVAAGPYSPEQGVLQATVNETQDVQRALRGGQTVLFRPYGTLDQLSTLALTPEEMRRSVSRAPDFQRAISALLQSQPFLFIGVTPGDVEQFFYAMAPDHAAQQPRHYLFLPRDPVNALNMSTLARFGVLLLEYDPRPDGSSPYHFVRSLRGEANELDANSDAELALRPLLSPDRIKRIRLENIGPFDEIEFEVSDGEPSPASPDDHDAKSESPWWVLFGGNGVGKSTVLRALAVALAGDTSANAAAGRRLLKSNRSHGLIEVQIGSQFLTTRIQSERSNVIVAPSQRSPVELGTTLALGFPALRGVRTPDPSGPSARTEIREPEPADLQALIASEVDSRLSDFKQWLVNTLVSAEQDPRAKVMRRLLNDLIREIIPGEIDALAPLRPGDFVIRVQTPDGEVPFDELSQGMASIFNWVGLLVQRLFTICESSLAPQDEPAIVIIDEIDAHLHPEWQRRLVPLTRKFFPNVQIIATSHSPLLAGSLRSHEMAVLARSSETSRIEVVPHGATYGLMSQDIMTSSVFAMATDRNPEVEVKIQRYCTLFEARVRTNQDEREMASLRRELDGYGFGPKATIDPPIVDDDHLERLRQRFAPGPVATP